MLHVEHWQEQKQTWNIQFRLLHGMHRNHFVISYYCGTVATTLEPTLFPKEQHVLNTDVTTWKVGISHILPAKVGISHITRFCPKFNFWMKSCRCIYFHLQNRVFVQFHLIGRISNTKAVSVVPTGNRVALMCHGKMFTHHFFVCTSHKELKTLV